MGSVLVHFPCTCPCFGIALGCSSLPMPWWAPALQPSGLCCLLGVTIPPRALDHKWNSSFTCARWQRASSAQMLFGQRRVTEVVNHITAVSLSSKHSHKFLNCVFCTGNYRHTEYLSLPLGSGFGPPPASVWLFPAAPCCVQEPNKNICSCIITFKGIPVPPLDIFLHLSPIGGLWDLKVKFSELQVPAASLLAHGHSGFLGWCETTFRF